jgi:hypothetical protein
MWESFNKKESSSAGQSTEITPFQVLIIAAVGLILVLALC